ncbi:MAG: hypothetical protein Q8P18_17625 [Pseudomonadota bacterium]|nr:hypothetical protein [Pseudomonadota bacterium]
MLIALTLLGCSAWIDQEPACDQDIYYWSDDLLAFVLTGDGSGDFEFDPEDTPRTEVAGSYDPDNGDSEWVAKYDADYYIRRTEAEGFGTVFHNGNLDLLFTETVTDMLGDVFETDYRVQRTGCDMTIASWDSSGNVDDAFVMAGSYSEDSVWSWEADFPGYSYTGSLRQNLNRTSLIEAEDGSYWAFTTAKPDGETTQDWTGDCGDGLTCEGTSTRHFDGTLESSLTAFDGEDEYAESVGSFEYDGSGVETITYVGGATCDFTYQADGDCEYECDDGEDGDCTA